VGDKKEKVTVIDNSAARPRAGKIRARDRAKRDRLGLSPFARKKLDARRRQRAKEAARDLAGRAYREVSDWTRGQLEILVAIMKDADAGKKGRRQVYRAFLEGLLRQADETAMVKELEGRNKKRTRATRGKGRKA
jgi:hypothetical protein